MKVFIADINSLIKRRDLLSDLKTRLSAKDKARLEAITNQRRAHEFLAGRYLIFKYFGNDFDVLKNARIVAKNRYLSLSHSKDYAAFAYADTPIGLDIEYMSPARDIAKIAKRMGFGICTQIEFYKKWTAREADFKLFSASHIKAAHHTYKIFGDYMICLSSLTPSTILIKSSLLRARG